MLTMAGFCVSHPIGLAAAALVRFGQKPNTATSRADEDDDRMSGAAAHHSRPGRCTHRQFDLVVLLP